MAFKLLKTPAFLCTFVILLMATVSCTEEAADLLSSALQQAIGADLGLKMLMIEDETPRGKCYCSCNLNSEPVFMEIDGNDPIGSFPLVEV